jgi:PAS domain S-box-containing protein
MNPIKDTAEAPPKDVLLLQKSFQDFNEATVRLQEAYASLEEKFEGINRELAEKNIILEKAIAEKEAVKNDLEIILDSLITGVVVTDLDGRIRTMNRCAGLFSGVTMDEVTGKHITILFQDGFPQEGASFDAREIAGKRRLKMRDRTVEVFQSPMKATDGGIIGSVYVLLDITRIEKLEDMAKRKEKLAAMGEMAANIAHEIRNPLGSIALFASLLVKELEDEKKRDRASQIISSVRNMDNKIANLLFFTRKQDPLLKRVNLHEILKEILFFAEEIISQEDISLSVKYTGGDPVIDGDTELLKQVFLNIVLNALQAMPDGGRLGIEVLLHGGDGDGTDADASVEVRFSDTGTGIATADLKKIFDPFFSTRERGTGLGLAIVHNIMDVHGGAIDVESREGDGTVISLMFPLADIGRERTLLPL